MAESFSYGGIQFPLPSPGTNSALRDADPALYYALDFTAAMITTYVGARMLAEASATGAPITSAVMMSVPYDPGPFLVKEQFQFPLLAIGRRRAHNEYRTVSLSRQETTWMAYYTLPPLTGAQAERLLPIMHAIPNNLANRLEKGWDSTYTPPGGTAGAKIWSSAFAGIDAIFIDDSEWVGFVGQGDLWFPTINMTMRVRELNGPPHGVPLQGIDNQISSTDASGNPVAGIADSNSNVIVKP